MQTLTLCSVEVDRLPEKKLQALIMKKFSEMQVNSEIKFNEEKNSYYDTKFNTEMCVYLVQLTLQL